MPKTILTQLPKDLLANITSRLSDYPASRRSARAASRALHDAAGATIVGVVPVDEDGAPTWPDGLPTSQLASLALRFPKARVISVLLPGVQCPYWCREVCRRQDGCADGRELCARMQCTCHACAVLGGYKM